MTDPTPEAILPAAMLERFRERAVGYDADNRFFSEDLAELRESGYLAVVVPGEIGGAGISLDTLVRCQRRLASYAPRPRSA
ncbi:hypothetical protein [Leucobacter insecticola]|uniref:hypothetical protein n=1 Tax=Leucobacter insecticola TaxID=2714934 RepID=UPI00197EA2B7|nr:hypothetical protein [Leucobacter insecticola]